MDWQPIETAPKDGAKVIGWIVYDGADDYGRALDIEPFEGFSVMWWDAGCVNAGFEREPGWHADLIGKPTHWALPAPPLGKVDRQRKRPRFRRGLRSVGPEP